MPTDLAVAARSPRTETARHLFHRARGTLYRAAPALMLYASVRLAGLIVVAAVAWMKSRPVWTVLGDSWDSRWYAGIARHGYGTVVPGELPGITRSDLAFFPLFPALERALVTIAPISPTLAGLIVAWTSAGAAAWGIYAVGERLHGRRTGIFLVLLWGLLPHAIVETMAYTESLMTALAAWSLYAVLTRRWMWAGILALFAGLTRPNAVAVAAAVLSAAAVVLWRSTSSRRDWRIWAGAALAPLGWLGYVAWAGSRSGGPLGYFAVQRDWGSRFDFGVSELHFVRRMLTDRGAALNLGYAMSLVVLLVAVPALVLLVLDRPPLPVLVYSLLLVIIAVGGSGYYASRPRFLLPAFPLLLPAALAMTRTRPRTATVMVAALAGVSFAYGVYPPFYAGTAP
ncbi:hypothetical protein [Streptomyces incanus]|uniref:Integral membrane protein n=1 Tax=Streptomyces incanus TaxID=887453 RepID=A0ABW0XP19_9ACTN